MPARLSLAAISISWAVSADVSLLGELSCAGGYDGGLVDRMTLAGASSG